MWFVARSLTIVEPFDCILEELYVWQVRVVFVSPPYERNRD